MMATRTTAPPDETLRERWSADFDDLRDELRVGDRWLRDVVRERPLLALGAAIAAGFAAGRVISRC